MYNCSGKAAADNTNNVIESGNAVFLRLLDKENVAGTCSLGKIY